jgi:ferric-dicitrate binding protein FerR (iron transport regulator)
MSSPEKARPDAARPLLLKRLAIALCAIVLAGGIVAYKIVTRPKPESAAPIEARLELAAGEVHIDQGAGETLAVSGTPIRAGASVSTATGSRALLRLPDGSRAFLRGGTRVVLGERQLKLESGEYWLDAPPAERTPLEQRIGEVRVTAVEAGLDIAKTKDGVRVYVARASVTGFAVETNGTLVEEIGRASCRERVLTVV